MLVSKIQSSSNTATTRDSNPHNPPGPPLVSTAQQTRAPSIGNPSNLIMIIILEYLYYWKGVQIVGLWICLSGGNKVMPSAQEALIIEKMAQYAVKNGDEFEGLAKTKGDLRFVFLQSSHPLHWYYLNCKQRLKATVASSNFVAYKSSSSGSTSFSHNSKYG